MRQEAVGQSEMPGHGNRGRRNTNPFIEVYDLQPAQPLPLSESSEDFGSPRARTPGSPQQHSRGSGAAQVMSTISPASPVDSEREESSAYAALPPARTFARMDSNPFRSNLLTTASRQSPVYDGGDEQVYSDSGEGHLMDVSSKGSYHCAVSPSGKVLHSSGDRSGSANPFTGHRHTSAGGGKPDSSRYSDSSMKKSGTGPWRGGERELSVKSFTPDRTYPIFCVIGQEAQVCWQAILIVYV